MDEEYRGGQARRASAPGGPPRAALVPLLVLLGVAAPASALARSLPAGGQPEGAAVARVITSAPVVALTFDACPTRLRVGFDREVFDILKREQVPATVFVSGKWMEKFWNEARELAAEPLIELGNHSYRHQFFSTMDSTRAREEIDVTDRLISALGRTSVGFRPPFGDWAGWVTAQTSGRPVVLWDVVSGDAGGHVRAETIVEKVVNDTQPGSIVIFHINGRGPHTKKALLPIIRRLRARGMRFVTVSELLGVEGGIIVKARPARYKKRELPPMTPVREIPLESVDADPKSTAQRSPTPG